MALVVGLAVALIGITVGGVIGVVVFLVGFAMLYLVWIISNSGRAKRELRRLPCSRAAHRGRVVSPMSTAALRLPNL
jgi:hypothetical protein